MRIAKIKSSVSGSNSHNLDGSRVPVQATTTTSVVEAPLFWAARAKAPEVRGPGADSGSDQIGSAPGNKKAAPTMALSTTIYHF